MKRKYRVLTVKEMLEKYKGNIKVSTNGSLRLMNYEGTSEFFSLYMHEYCGREFEAYDLPHSIDGWSFQLWMLEDLGPVIKTESAVYRCNTISVDSIQATTQGCTMSAVKLIMEGPRVFLKDKDARAFAQEILEICDGKRSNGE